MIKFKMPNEIEFKPLSAKDFSEANSLIKKYIDITGSKFSVDDALIDMGYVNFDNFPKALVAILKFLDVSQTDLYCLEEENILDYFGFAEEFDADFFKKPKLYDISYFSLCFDLGQPCTFLEEDDIIQYLQDFKEEMILLEISERDGEFYISEKKASLKKVKPKLVLEDL